MQGRFFSMATQGAGGSKYFYFSVAFDWKKDLLKISWVLVV